MNQDFRITIQDYFRAFLYNNLGKKPKTALESEEFKKLFKKGLIKKHPVDSLQVLFTLGKAQAILGDVVKEWVKSDVIKFESSEEGKLTRVEENSLDFLRAEGEDRLESLFGNIKADIQNNYKNRLLGGDVFKRDVRDALSQKILDRKTIQQLSSDIGKKTGVWGRDLYRIAFTESHNAYNFGVAFGYMKKTGKMADEIRIALIPRGRGISCNDCLKLYLKPGTNEPKVFKLSEIIGNSNVGRKRREWVPCVSSTHPFCQCTPVIVFVGQVWTGKRFEFPKKDK